MGFFEFLFSSFVGILVFLLLLTLYFLPTIIALITKKRNALAIFLLNFFLGWSFIGWVVALVWSVTKD
jgi:tryptophan-rich sensory protein